MYLYGEHAHAAGALGQDRVAGLQRSALEAVKRVPCRQRGAGQGARLLEIQRCGHDDESILVECSVLTKYAIDRPSKAGALDGRGHGAPEMRLVEKRHDLVSRLETCHLRANGLDSTGAIGGGDDVVALWE